MKFQIFEYDKLLDRSFITLINLTSICIVLPIAFAINFQPIITLLLGFGCASLNLIPYFQKRISTGFIQLDNDAIFINDAKISFEDIKLIKVKYDDYEGSTWWLTLSVDTGLNKIKIVTAETDYTYLFLSKKKTDSKFLESYIKLLKENNVPCKIRIGLFA